MPTFTAEIIISFSDLNHNESVIPKYSKMQGCTRFERFRKKKIQKKKKKKKEKKERKKKGKAPRLGFESSSTRSGLTNLWC